MKFTNALFAEALVPPDINRRRGTFRVSLEMIQEDFLSVRKSMQNLVVINADYNIASQVIEYEAVSPDFDVVPDGEISPPYQATMFAVGAKIVKVEWHLISKGTS